MAAKAGATTAAQLRRLTRHTHADERWGIVAGIAAIIATTHVEAQAAHPVATTGPARGGLSLRAQPPRMTVSASQQDPTVLTEAWIRFMHAPQAQESRVWHFAASRENARSPTARKETRVGQNFKLVAETSPRKQGTERHAAQRSSHH